MTPPLEREKAKLRLWDEYNNLGLVNVHPSAFATYDEMIEKRAMLTLRRNQIMNEILALEKD